MEKYSCEKHIDHALDMFVAEEKVFPIMDKIEEDKKLSTKCSYCEEPGEYIVSRK
ncbi:CxxH/CxxC protein [Lysinibacillus parviboronicapiens]|uniref:CxxH/CxxC protein (TIGR04129 family) n=1 Tax=Lysinibacillus parviboronicapiens TaxID=436516 RepID=A0ABV2PNQ6_9BACI|nr:CxxH/CxxC protein [Lysinibacillus parviboronicapiens]